MKNTFADNADFVFINSQMKQAANAQTFSMPPNEYSPARVESIIHMLQTSGYSARKVKIKGQTALHVEAQDNSVELVTVPAIEELDCQVSANQDELFAAITGSSTIRQIKWKAGILSIQFTSGDKTYTWDQVPESLFYEFKNAPSHGKFYNQNVKNKFPEVSKG